MTLGIIVERVPMTMVITGVQSWIHFIHFMVLAWHLMLLRADMTLLCQRNYCGGVPMAMVILWGPIISILDTLPGNVS